MPKATVTLDDKLAVKDRLAAARARLGNAHESNDKKKARAARRSVRLAKRDLRAIARIPAPAPPQEEAGD